MSLIEPIIDPLEFPKETLASGACPCLILNADYQRSGPQGLCRPKPDSGLHAL